MSIIDDRKQPIAVLATWSKAGPIFLGAFNHVFDACSHAHKMAEEHARYETMIVRVVDDRTNRALYEVRPSTLVDTQ